MCAVGGERERDPSYRHSGFGPHSTPEWVHVHLLRDEVQAIEHDAVQGALPRLRHECDDLRRELRSAREDAAAAVELVLLQGPAANQDATHDYLRAIQPVWSEFLEEHTSVGIRP